MFDPLTEQSRSRASAGSEAGPASNIARTFDDGNYSFQTISSEAELLSIQAEWNSLHAASGTGNAFTSFDWTWTWWEHFGAIRSPERQLFIQVVRRAGRVVGIAPLVRRRTRRGRIDKVELLGFPLADYPDFLLAPGEARAVSLLLRHLSHETALWDLMELRDLSPAFATASLLKDALNQLPLHGMSYPEDACPYIEIGGDWESVLQQHSRRTRHTFRAQSRRLKELGAEIQVLDHLPQGRGLMERLSELDGAKRWNRFALPPLYSSPEFFRSLFNRLGPSGQLYVALLEKSGSLIAGELGFKAGKKLWCYWRAFDAAYRALSPGTLLLGAVIDYGFRNGYSEYDFTRGDEDYKKRWAHKARQNVGFLFWHESWVSRSASFLYRNIRPGLDRLGSRWQIARQGSETRPTRKDFE